MMINLYTGLSSLFFGGYLMSKSIPNGVYPTMVTPYTADNKIDYNAVEAIMQWYSENGVDGIFAICQSSEIFFLSFEEKLELLKFIMKNKPKDMTIVASGHTADDIETQIYQANAYIEQGIDAYVFISNRLAKAEEDDSVFFANYDKFIKAIPEVPLGIYECPYPYKRLMTPEALHELSLGGRMAFLKDTCCDVDMINAKLKAVEGTQLKIFNANAATLLETLKLGCAGYSGVMANFHPEIYSWLCKNYASQPEKAQVVQNFLGLASMAECQQYPVNAKYHLSLCDVDMGYTSRARDAAQFKPNHKMEIEQLFGSANHLKAELGIK